MIARARTRPGPVRAMINALAWRRAGDGAQIFLENVVALLPDAWPDAELHVVLRSDAAMPVEGATVHRIPVSSTVGRLAADQFVFPRLVASVRPDVLVNPNESIALRVDVPLVVVAQNLMYHCDGVGPLRIGPLAVRVRSRLQFAYYRRQLPRAFRRADVVVAVSEHAARVLERRAELDHRRVRVVPCGADRLPVRARRDRSGGKMLLAIGSVSHYKRSAVLVAALRMVRERGGDHELVIVGSAWPGCGEELDRAAAAAGVADAVRRVGLVDDNRLADLLAEAHAVCSLSSCESFGIPVVEAMRAGVPVVVADEGWSRETVSDAGLRVRGDDPAAVAAAIESLADEDRWQDWSARGRERAALFTWRRTADGVAAAAQAAARS